MSDLKSHIIHGESSQNKDFRMVAAKCGQLIQDVRQVKYEDSEHRTGDRRLKHLFVTIQEYSLAAFRWSNGNF